MAQPTVSLTEIKLVEAAHASEKVASPQVVSELWERFRRKKLDFTADAKLPQC